MLQLDREHDTSRFRGLRRVSPAHLLVVDGPHPRLVALGTAPVTLGSGPAADVVIRAPGVRARHCRLEPLPGARHRASDLHGEAGLIVNDSPAAGAVLGPLDRLRLGEATLVYLGGLEPSPDLLALGSGELSVPARLVQLVLRLQDLAAGEELGAELTPVLEEILSCTGHERAMLALLPPEGCGRRLHAVAAAHVDDDLRDAALVQSLALVEECLAADAPVRGTTSLGAPGATLCFPLHGPRTWLGPERRGARLGLVRGGLLLATNDPQLPEMRPDGASLLQGVARQLAHLLAGARLRRQATQDPLTNLLTRACAEQSLTEELARAGRAGTALAVVLLDLDDFKRINDACGHVAGDEVLRALGERLRATLRQEDLAGRWGGEELLVVAPGVDVFGAWVVAERLVTAIGSRPLGPAGLNVTASAGVALFPDHGRDALELVRRADLALYAAKRAGKNRARVFDPGLEVAAAGAVAPAEPLTPAGAAEQEPAAWLHCPLLGDVALRPGTTWIGRTEGCALLLPHTSVSRRHAALHVAGDGGVQVEDCSRNGTLVNGIPIVGRVTLSRGDRVSIGPYALELLRERRERTVETHLRLPRGAPRLGEEEAPAAAEPPATVELRRAVGPGGSPARPLHWCDPPDAAR